MKVTKYTFLTVMAFTAITVMAPLPARAHHSFSMYNITTPVAITGVLVRSNVDAFHYQMFIAQLNQERKSVVLDKHGKPVFWAIELDGAATVAREGITEKNFPPGTIVSVGFYPLRNGSPGGARNRLGLYTCPGKTTPASGRHCDSVEGSRAFGGQFAPGTKEAKVTADGVASK